MVPISSRRVGQLMILIAFNFVVAAQVPDPDEFEKALLPVYVVEKPGAHGSLWASDLSIFNGGEDDSQYYLLQTSCFGTCFLPRPAELRAGQTAQPRTQVGDPVSGPGAFIYLKREDASRLALSLRIRDLSRQSETFGTEIPVIREDEFLTGASYLSTAPVNPEFRQMLRVYDLDNNPSAEFVVQLLSPEGILIASFPVTTLFRSAVIVEGFPGTPGYAEIANLESMLPAGQFADHGASIIIEPLTPGVRYWAFVSVTHDGTQHTTLITPQ